MDSATEYIKLCVVILLLFAVLMIFGNPQSDPRSFIIRKVADEVFAV